METLAFILHNLPAIGERTVEHISIVSVAVGFAILTGVPLGIAITQSQRTADTVLYLGSIVMTIPSIALFGVLIPVLVARSARDRLPAGGDRRDALRAAADHPQHLTAIRNVDPALRSAAHRHGDVAARSGCARRDPDRAAGDHRRRPHRGRHQHRRHGDRGVHRRRRARHVHHPRHLADGYRGSSSPARSTLGLLAIAADYALLWLQRRLAPKGRADSAPLGRMRPRRMIRLEDLTRPSDAPGGTVTAVAIA